VGGTGIVCDWAALIRRPPFLDADMFALKNKVALVTGGASGIGLEPAAGLAVKGCRIVIGDILDRERLDLAAKTIGGECLAVPMDVTDTDQVTAAFDATQSHFGGLDILFNNAGLFTRISRGPLEDLDISEWEQVFAVNVTRTFRVITASLPLLKKSGRGRILNISPATVFSAPPNMLHYVSSKGPLAAMTKSMARELGSHGIAVNAIAPGFTLSTGVVEAANENIEIQRERAQNARAVKRDQMPDDPVGATCFLASEAGFVTGQTLVVDGGAVMH
jgi:NAD(P)-dependent dehydrogenase (short-subunit alcohol dehydrogenase family)